MSNDILQEISALLFHLYRILHLAVKRTHKYCNEGLSIISAIEEALTRHKHLYAEMPAMVLLGPEELENLIAEIQYMGTIKVESPLSIFGMMVVPKCGDGIDFTISSMTSKHVMLNKVKQPLAQHDN